MPALMPSPYRVNKPPAGSRVDWSHPLARGLMLSLDMLEGSGKTTADSTGVFGTCAIDSGVTWAASGGPHGPALNFGGGATLNKVYINGTAALWTFGTGPFSIEAWFRTTQNAAGNFFRIDNNTNGLIVLRVNTGGVIDWGYFTSARGAIVYISSPTAYNNGAWHHAVGIRDTVGGLGRLVIDGKQVVTGADAGGSQSSPAAPVLGEQDATHDFESYNGQLACVRVWNRTLTVAEAQQLYAEPYALLRGPDAWRRL